MGVHKYLIRRGGNFEGGPKGDVVTTYPIDLFTERVIIGVCTLGKRRFTRMAKPTTIGR